MVIRNKQTDGNIWALLWKIPGDERAASVHLALFIAFFVCETAITTPPLQGTFLCGIKEGKQEAGQP